MTKKESIIISGDASGFQFIEDPVFKLAKEVFLKTCGNEYLNDKTRKGYTDRAKNAIAVANLFIEEFEKKDTE